MSRTPWSDALLPKKCSDMMDIRAIRREMSYKCNGRIYYPRFWLEAAIDFLRAPEETVPSPLNSYSYQHLVSCFIRAEPSSAWGHRNEWYVPGAVRKAE
jgi:hypothetical protein